MAPPRQPREADSTHTVDRCAAMKATLIYPQFLELGAGVQELAGRSPSGKPSELKPCSSDQPDHDD
jgi:hypothetical protein